MKTEFVKELEQLLNKHSMEQDSNTPDFLLATYLAMCLDAWNTTSQARDRWYGREKPPGGSGETPGELPVAP